MSTTERHEREDAKDRAELLWFTVNKKLNSHLKNIIDRMVSCMLKHLTRKIKSNVIRRFDVSNIIIKNGENV